MDELNLASERVQELIARLSNVNFYCSVVVAGTAVSRIQAASPGKNARKNDSSVRKISGGKNSA